MVLMEGCWVLAEGSACEQGSDLGRARWTRPSTRSSSPSLRSTPSSAPSATRRGKNVTVWAATMAQGARAEQGLGQLTRQEPQQTRAVARAQALYAAAWLLRRWARCYSWGTCARLPDVCVMPGVLGDVLRHALPVEIEACWQGLSVLVSLKHLLRGGAWLVPRAATPCGDTPRASMRSPMLPARSLEVAATACGSYRRRRFHD